MKKGGQLDLLTASAEAKAANESAVDGKDKVGVGFETGRQAAEAGKFSGDNPYEDGSEQAKNWTEGFMSITSERAMALGGGKGKPTGKKTPAKKSAAAKKAPKGQVEAHA